MKGEEIQCKDCGEDNPTKMYNGVRCNACQRVKWKNYRRRWVAENGRKTPQGYCRRTLAGHHLIPSELAPIVIKNTEYLARRLV